MGNLEQAAEKKPLIVLTGPTAVGKTALLEVMEEGKDTPGGDGRCAAPSDRYFRAD